MDTSSSEPKHMIGRFPKHEDDIIKNALLESEDAENYQEIKYKQWTTAEIIEIVGDLLANGSEESSGEPLPINARVSSTGGNVYEIDEFSDELFEKIEQQDEPPAKATFIKKSKCKGNTIYEVWYWYLAYKDNPRHQGDDGLDLFCKCWTLENARRVVRGQIALANNFTAESL